MSNNFYVHAYIRSKDSATAKAETLYYIGITMLESNLTELLGEYNAKN